MTQALILIDIQNDYFPGGKMELVGMEAAASKARALLDKFRGKDAPIVHIQHFSTRPDASFFLPDTPGVEHHASVKPQPGETVVKKNFPSAFRDTGLAEQLRTRKIDHLVIVGAMSHMCIDASTRAAFDLGFHCTVIDDACATRDLVFKDEKVEAKKVHAAYMASLSWPYARVIDAGSFNPD